MPLVTICIGMEGLLAAGRAGARKVLSLLNVGVLVGLLLIGRVGTLGAIIGVGVLGVVGALGPVKKLLVVALTVLGIIGPMTGWGVGPRSGLRLKALLGLMTKGLTGLSLFLIMGASLGLRLTLNEVWGRGAFIRIGAKVGVLRGLVGVGVGEGVGVLQLRELLIGLGMVLFLSLPAIPRF